MPRNYLPRITHARVIRPYVIQVTFSDGARRQYDVEHLLDLPVFQSLRDPGCFAQVRIDPEWNTVVWPNDADIAPETIYDYGVPIEETVETSAP